MSSIKAAARLTRPFNECVNSHARGRTTFAAGQRYLLFEAGLCDRYRQLSRCDYRACHAWNVRQSWAWLPVRSRLAPVRSNRKRAQATTAEWYDPTLLCSLPHAIQHGHIDQGRTQRTILQLEGQPSYLLPLVTGNSQKVLLRPNEHSERTLPKDDSNNKGKVKHPIFDSEPDWSWQPPKPGDDAS